MTTLLTNATLKQLITDRPDLVANIKAGKDQGSSFVVVAKDTEGKIKTWTEESRDFDNILMGTRKNNYSYYPTGEIDTIIQERYEGKNLVSKIRLKHYRNGSQLSVEIMTIVDKIWQL